MRRAGWEQSLFEITSAAIKTPHKWGEHDCVTFAADCVAAMTGDDPAFDVRGTYDGPIGAARVMRDMGYADLGDLLANRLKELAPAFAKRGDLALCDGPHGEFVGVVQGATIVGPGVDGLMHVPTSAAYRAFKVD